ncbi:hypothetical protein D3C75_903400 [compost metagenome]
MFHLLRFEPILIGVAHERCLQLNHSSCLCRVCPRWEWIADQKFGDFATCRVCHRCGCTAGGGGGSSSGGHGVRKRSYASLRIHHCHCCCRPFCGGLFGDKPRGRGGWCVLCLYRSRLGPGHRFRVGLGGSAFLHGLRARGAELSRFRHADFGERCARLSCSLVMVFARCMGAGFHTRLPPYRL